MEFKIAFPRDFSAKALVVPVFRDLVYLKGSGTANPKKRLPDAASVLTLLGSAFDPGDFMALGCLDEVPVFSLDLSGFGEAVGTVLETGALSRTSPKTLAADPESALFSLCARAVHLGRWRRMNLYCGGCGKRNQSVWEELAMECPSCGEKFYPRISPAVIVAVTRSSLNGLELLMAKRRASKSGFYGLIAGFVEAGESAEEAVRREVLEEAGIELGDLSYVCSQAWPFPDSLMLGYLADFSRGELKMQAKELEDLGWFGGSALPPQAPPGSLSRRLTELVFGP